MNWERITITANPTTNTMNHDPRTCENSKPCFDCEHPTIEKQITLAGFGDFSENEEGLKELKDTAKKHNVEFYPTYYDHALKGKAEDIEAVTMELWGMPRDLWEENALSEEAIINQ